MGTFAIPICLSQPPTQKGWTLDGHLRQDSPSSVPTPSPKTPQPHLSTGHRALRRPANASLQA